MQEVFWYDNDMNIQSSAKTILCFGDSNTHGQMSESKDRWNKDVRWTAQLQRKLGDGYAIIEEGLNSRTTDLDYAAKPGRNGKEYLRPCLETHNPLDMVIIMLGTNDLKTDFNRSVEEIADAIRGLIHDIKTYARSPEGELLPQNIYLVSPILVDETKDQFTSLYSDHYDSISAEKSRQLAKAYYEVAQQEHVTFMDAAAIAQPGVDGIHFSKESHDRFSSELASLIQEHL